MASIKSLGVGWIRADLAWPDVQPDSASSYNWSRFDTIVAASNANGISVLPVLTYTPAWARPAGCSTEFCAPAIPAQFAMFARAAVARYAPQGVHYWEVWNEPNSADFWAPAANPAAYVNLLQTTVPLMRAADPKATVISGSLAPEATGGGHIAQLQYLSEFCAAGGAALVDAIGYHPYSYPVLPNYSASWNAWQQIDQTSPSFVSILKSYGAGSKKIWLTEFGAPTGGPGAEATSSNLALDQSPDHVDQAMQASMASTSVSLAASDPNVEALFWYSYQDLGTDTSTVENFFGLRNHDGTPKPAWFALQSAIQQLR